MLISEILEKTQQMSAAENMANRLADKVRNLWLTNRAEGSFLRRESFPGLLGIDYIFKWWGNDDIEGLAGELEVLWKVEEDHGVAIYKTWIRLADRDFVIGPVREESEKREVNRKEFRRAFAQWEQLYNSRKV